MYRLTSVEVLRGDEALVGPSDWELWAGEAQALVGLGGSGKSVLLQLLSGRRPSAIHTKGRWEFEKGGLAEAWESQEPVPSAAWVPQRRHAGSRQLSDEQLEQALARIDAAFLSSSSILLLDEPERGLPEAERERLAARIRKHTDAGGSALIVTHHMAFAESFADRVTTLAEGELRTQSAGDFFEHGHAYCCDGSDEAGWLPELPSTFKWIDEGVLAGTGAPGLLRSLDEDLMAMSGHGVSLLVTLTESGLDRNRLRPYGLENWHFPIRDMTAPVSTGQTIGLVCRIIAALERGEVAAVHCRAGVGRTGMVLACIRAAQGADPSAAVAEVRRVNPFYMQTAAQEAFVSRFADDFHGSGKA